MLVRIGDGDAGAENPYGSVITFGPGANGSPVGGAINAPSEPGHHRHPRFGQLAGELAGKRQSGCRSRARSDNRHAWLIKASQGSKHRECRRSIVVGAEVSVPTGVPEHPPSTMCWR